MNRNMKIRFKSGSDGPTSNRERVERVGLHGNGDVRLKASVGSLMDSRSVLGPIIDLT